MDFDDDYDIINESDNDSDNDPDINEIDEIIGGLADAALDNDNDDITSNDDEDEDDEDYEVSDDILVDNESKYIKEIIVVKSENRRTSNIMSKFEMTEAVSIRAVQISEHNNPMIETTLTDPIDIAKCELMMRKCPLILERHLGDVKENGKMISYYEFWCPNEMAFALNYDNVM